MRQVNYPVYVYARDCHEFETIASYSDLLGRLEPVDIDNEEYWAWDADGRPLKLSAEWKSGDWLIITHAEELPHLESFLTHCTHLGIESINSSKNTRFAALLE